MPRFPLVPYAYGFPDTCKLRFCIAAYSAVAYAHPVVLNSIAST